MDELRVSSKLMNHLISRFVRSKIKKSWGRNVNVSFNQIVATVKDEDKVRVHIELDADTSSVEFEKLMMTVLGLEDENG